MLKYIDLSLQKSKEKFRQFKIMKFLAFPVKNIFHCAVCTVKINSIIENFLKS